MHWFPMAGDSQPAVMCTPTKSNMCLELVVWEECGSESRDILLQWLRLVEHVAGCQCQLPVWVSIRHWELSAYRSATLQFQCLTGLPERPLVHKWNRGCLKGLGTEGIACTLDSFSHLCAVFRCLCLLCGKLSRNSCVRFLSCNKTSENGVHLLESANMLHNGKIHCRFQDVQKGFFISFLSGWCLFSCEPAD